MKLKRYDRAALLLTLAAASFVLACGVVRIGDSAGFPGRWVASAGLLFTLAGVLQLEVSGFFDKLSAHYSDEKSYPLGPPSHITRELIDNPDRPSAMALRSLLFFRVRTGFWLIVAGTVTQLLSVWL